MMGHKESNQTKSSYSDDSHKNHQAVLRKRNPDEIFCINSRPDVASFIVTDSWVACHIGNWLFIQSAYGNDITLV